MPQFQIPFSLQQIENLSKNHPTPFYIYDEGGIEDSNFKFIKYFQANLDKDYCNYFAVKATPNPAILKLLSDLGMGFDCSSMAELILMEKIGQKNQKLKNGLPSIIFTSNQTDYKEYQKCIDLGGIINFDDIGLLDYFEENIGEFPEIVSVRFNPGKERVFGENDRFIGNPADAKFGMPRKDVFEAFKILKSKGVKTLGLHTMVVSNEINPEAHILTLKMLLDLVEELAQAEIKIEFINLGGGMGVAYRPEQEELDLETLSKDLGKTFAEYKTKNPAVFENLKIMGENGRMITGQFGYLVTKIRHNKNTYKNYLGTDSTMANLMRPGMYDAYHYITNISAKERGEQKTETYDVVGSLCENNDKFAVDRKLPISKSGDILVIHTAGAHGHSMGFNYNGKLRSSEFMLKKDGSFEMIRRAETYDDLFASLNW